MTSEEFNEQLDRLNTEQRAAVEHIYGPVMVIAGPGTGKTQILSMRIAQILSVTDASPHNILCLTYTDAGTVAMRKRLTQIIGADAYNINIYTFHAFCNKIISEYSNLFSDHDDLRAIDDLERLDLFIEMIDGWPTNHPLKKLKGDFYQYRKSLMSLFDTMKTEGWSSEYVVTRADQYLAELPLREEYIYKRKSGKFEKGDVKQNAIDKKTEQIERFKAGAKAFDEFNALMNKNGRFDYADMILWVRDAMKKNEDLLYSLQEQYQFILLDEYQDTNGAQNDVLFLLCGAIDSQPNVFAVGDDDQSIYRFQGANLSNITEFMTRWSQDLFHVVLEDNYRSSSDILNASGTLIDENLERLSQQFKEINKNLVAAGDKNKQYESGVLIGNFESETDELLGVSRYVEKLLETGVPANEIAILFRKRKHVQPLIKYFATENIPHNVTKLNNVYHDPFIQKLLTVLRYIQQEIELPFGSNHLLFEILHYDWFDIPSLDIATIALAKNKDRENNWRKWLADEAFLDSLSLQKKAEIMEVGSLIETWIKSGINDTVQILFEKIIYSPPIFKYMSASGETFHYLKSISTFFNFIKDQTDKHTQLKLTDLLRIVDRMNEHDLALQMNRIDKTGDGIQLMTAHGSKGLEFDHVIIIGANSKKWEEARAPSGKFSFPDTIVVTNNENKIEDERRLFYVCMTRARKEVLITYSEKLLDGKSAAPSRFVIETEKSGVTRPWMFNSSTAEKEKFLFSQFAPIQLPIKGWPPQIDEIIQSMTWNITGVNKYLTCPITFYFENILRAPSARSAPMGYGNAIHDTLEAIFNAYNSSQDDVFPSLEHTLSLFSVFMEKYHSHFTPTQYGNYVENGKIKLTAYYNHHIDEWKALKGSLAEHKVSNVEVGGIPVSGLYDRADFINDELVVVDYKTGSSIYGIKKMAGPAKNIDELQVQLSQQNDPDERDKIRLKIQGGDYWRQLVFYKLLAGVDPKISKPFRNTYISFIESDDSPKLYRKELTVTPDDEAIVLQQLKDVHAKVQRKEFSDGCGRSRCQWCNLTGSI